MAKTSVEDAGVAIPVEWPDTIDLPTIYANQLFIHHTGNEFFMTFGELQPPIVVGSKEERREKLKATAIRGVTIRPVARLAISPPAMMAIAEVIRENTEKFKESSIRLKSDTEKGDTH